MATLDELELRLRALEQAQAAEPISYYTSIFSGEEMDQRLAAAGVLGAASTPQEALAALGAAVQDNELDNAYFVGGGTGWGVFPVNQRGVAQSSGESAMFDRWSLYNSTGGSVSLTENGLSIVGGNPYTVIKQMLKRALPVGATYSMSLLQHDGSFYSGVVTIPAKDAYSQSIPIFSNGSQFRLYGPNSFELVVVNGDTLTETEIIKLEPGGTQTAAYKKSDGTWAMLPQGIDYRQELAKCQAYYWEGDNLCFHAYRAAGYNAVIQVPLPGPMRVDSPAVTISGLLISSTGASESITPASTYGATSGILIIESPVSTLDGTFVGNAQVISIAVNAEL